MRKDLTDITVVLDRSGSMASCLNEAENGLNHFIEEQKKQPGHALFSLIQFDTEYEFIHKGLPIRDVPRCVLQPRGMTALLDAVGRAINETGQRLAAKPERERPGLVVFVIVTDGQENSSHEFRKSQIKRMIEEQQKTYNWQFTFLGANQDAFAEARGIGIAVMAAANFNPHSARLAFECASNNVVRMRGAIMREEPLSSFFTPEERESMAKSK